MHMSGQPSTIGESPIKIFRDDFLEDKYEDLLEDYPSYSTAEISRIQNTLKNLGSDENLDILNRICFDNDLLPEELRMMEILFNNRLDSVSKNGITIFEIDKTIEIRNDGEKKFLSSEERRKMARYFSTQSDESEPYGYVGTAVDTDLRNTQMKWTSGGTMKVDEKEFDGSLKNLQINETP